MMISVKLAGGLGNQLFQIFTTTAYAIRHNLEVGLIKTETVGNRRTYWNTLLKDLSVTDTCEAYKDYNELSYTYSELPAFKESTRLVGYFQSYKYFENEYDKILNSIKLQDQQAIIQKKYSLHGTCLHFRRGDYKHVQEYHPLMPYEYYRSALIQIENKDDVFYFCEAEDNEEVGKIVDLLSIEFDNRFIKVSDDIEDWEQLLMMSCCEHNIIANSTFSWWGAYFNNNANKKVCYPANWFGPQIQYDTIDLCPKNWHRIKL
jgi:hypothetical protein